ncbi:MAG: diaminopimelate epimerase [Candidatus Omnitrophica bacterium]|nr:diaminopimelate epimerase [Candidatus Omnitrophota bacterium]
MKRIAFVKMVASGNDFVLIENHGYKGLSLLAKSLCDRKFGIGADGLLLLEKSSIADIRMRIFNADGSEAQMCGNGSRCVAFWLKAKRIETKAGIIEARVAAGNVKIKLTSPKGLRLDMPVEINKRKLRINFIDTGVPHAVIFTQGLDKINVSSLGRAIRYHAKFAPAGTNANFIEVLDKDSISIRTYERGVEDETLACGTGTVASALVFALKSGACAKVNVHTRSKEVLKVYFERRDKEFSNIWLEGSTRVVFKGEIIY